MTDETPTAFPTLSKVLIGNELIETVDARAFHSALGVKRDFSTWFRERIDSYNFLENQDFVIFPETGEKSGRGRPGLAFAISLDMAKELAMLERTEKGRGVRRYFIECERRVKAEMRPGQAAHAARDFSAAFKGFVGKLCVPRFCPEEYLVHFVVKLRGQIFRIGQRQIRVGPCPAASPDSCAKH